MTIIFTNVQSILKNFLGKCECLHLSNLGFIN